MNFAAVGVRLGRPDVFDEHIRVLLRPSPDWMGDKVLGRKPQCTAWSTIDQTPEASFTHFVVKLFSAAPWRFFALASIWHFVVASFSHFVMKLLRAAPASFLSLAVASQVASAANEDAENSTLITTTKAAFIVFSTTDL